MSVASGVQFTFQTFSLLITTFYGSHCLLAGQAKRPLYNPCSSSTFPSFTKVCIVCGKAQAHSTRPGFKPRVQTPELPLFRRHVGWQGRAVWTKNLSYPRDSENETQTVINAEHFSPAVVAVLEVREQQGFNFFPILMSNPLMYPLSLSNYFHCNENPDSFRRLVEKELSEPSPDSFWSKYYINHGLPDVS